MAYTFYLGDTMLPVPPPELQIKIKNQNKTINLIDEGEVNLLKRPGLTEISFTALIPNQKYPFAQYAGGFKGAAFFLDVLEKLKTDRDKDGSLIPFQFIVSRVLPSGALLFDTNIKVALEDYKIVEEAGNGFDLKIDVALKQYRPYGTKTVEIKQPAPTQASPVAQIQTPRPAETAPQPRTYTVANGDSLWAIAQKCLNDGSRYPEIYSLNQPAIDARNKGAGLSKYTIYPGQVLTLPS